VQLNIEYGDCRCSCALYSKEGEQNADFVVGGRELNQLSVGCVMDILEELAVAVFRAEMSE
jgi:hypothetical protein